MKLSDRCIRTGAAQANRSKAALFKSRQKGLTKASACTGHKD
jgi:hypothetical protein